METEFQKGFTAGIVLAIAMLLRAGATGHANELLSSAGIKPDEDLSFCADFDLAALRNEYPEFKNVFGSDVDQEQPS